MLGDARIVVIRNVRFAAARQHERVAPFDEFTQAMLQKTGRGMTRVKRIG